MPGVHPWALCPSPPKDQERPQHLDSSAGTGVKSGPLPAVRPLLLWAPFFCCASFARRTSVLWCQLKVCQLSHAVPVVPYRVTCCYRENFGSITFPAVLPKLWLPIYPTPPHPSQIRDHLSSLCRIPSDFSAPLLSWLEGTGHKIRWTHPNPPCQAQELHPGAEQCWFGSGGQLSAREPVLAREDSLVLCDPSQPSPGPGAEVPPACLCLENHVRDSRAAPPRS